MDYKEFCYKIDRLNIAKISAFRYLTEGVLYNYNIIKRIIESIKIYSQVGLTKAHHYDKALDYFQKMGNKNFTYKELILLADYFSWKDYIARFENYINYLCDKYNKSLNKEK